MSTQAEKWSWEREAIWTLFRHRICMQELKKSVWMYVCMHKNIFMWERVYVWLAHVWKSEYNCGCWFSSTFRFLFEVVCHWLAALHSWCPQSSDSLELEWNYRCLWATMWVLEMKPGSCARAATAINHWTISLVHKALF